MSVDQTEEQHPSLLDELPEAPVERVRVGDSPTPAPDPEYVSQPRAESPEEEPTVKPMPERDEAERLDPQPLEMRLENGMEFDLEPLKLRQFLRLLRIVTRGAADVLDTARLDFEDPNSFVQTFLGMVLFSIPEAEEETVDFLKSMVRPKDMTGDNKRDLMRVQELSEALDNPELEDAVTIVQAVVERESEDLRNLGKRLSRMFKVAEKMGATSPNGPNPA